MENEQLLLTDLCARLPYGVKIMFSYDGFRWDREQTLEEISRCEDGEYAINGWGIHGIKPYLRSLSSMTEEEKEKFINLRYKIELGVNVDLSIYNYLKFLYSHHIDVDNRLLHRNLAIEAPADMYI